MTSYHTIFFELGYCLFLFLFIDNDTKVIDYVNYILPLPDQSDCLSRAIYILYCERLLCGTYQSSSFSKEHLRYCIMPQITHIKVLFACIKLVSI